MNWLETENKLELMLSFNSMESACTFLLEVARLSDLHKHHPDVELFNCSILRFRLYTHEANSITAKDEDLAKAISTCYTNWCN